MSDKRKLQLNALKSYLHVIKYEQHNSDGIEPIKLKIGNKDFIEISVFDLLNQLYNALNEDVAIEFDDIDNYISDSLLDLKSEISGLEAQLNYWKNPTEYDDPRD